MKRTAIRPSTFESARDGPPVGWAVATGAVDYAKAVVAMERRADAIAAATAPECVWLVEHPAIYTAGTSARDQDLARSPRFPVHKTGRGGQYTYHGPGQRVAYVMLDLQCRQPDVRAYVVALEAWIMATLAHFNVRGERREGRVGVWVRRLDKPAGWDGGGAEDKIAAIGIRLRRWVSFHGIAVNIEPDLSHFADIAPCGISASHFGVTSLADLGHHVALPTFDTVLRHQFETIFGVTCDEASLDPGSALRTGRGGDARPDRHAPGVNSRPS